MGATKYSRHSSSLWEPWAPNHQLNHQLGQGIPLLFKNRMSELREVPTTSPRTPASRPSRATHRHRQSLGGELSFSFGSLDGCWIMLSVGLGLSVLFIFQWGAATKTCSATVYQG